MKLLLIICVSLFVTANAHSIHKRAAGDQQPKVWDALRVLRGGKDLSIEDMMSILANSVPGKDYPINALIPASSVDCAQFKQPGFYADDSSPSRCQVFHRCDVDSHLTSYLCPNLTLFNQITLICDWFYNIDCPSSSRFQDYSNSRLYSQNDPLLDNQDVYVVQAATGAVKVAVAPLPAAPASTKKAKKNIVITTTAATDETDEGDSPKEK